jgi:hypothetical protein
MSLNPQIPFKPYIQFFCKHEPHSLYYVFLKAFFDQEQFIYFDKSY